MIIIPTKASIKNAPHPPSLSTLRSVSLSDVSTMITSTTSNKLAEIIRDTWPNLYRPMKMPYNEQKNTQDEQVQQ